MSKSMKRYLNRFLLGFAVMLFGSIALCGEADAEPVLTARIFINDHYRPGEGLPIGKIQSVQYGVFIIHADQHEGYRAQAGLPVYKGDILVTNRRGRALGRLNDGSIFRLGSTSRVAVLRSSYHTAEKVSDALILLDIGLARFQLKGFAGFRSREFTVRSPVAEIIAKEGDFIVRSSPEHTDVTAVVNCRLEVSGRESPESITDLSQYTRAVVEKGAFAAKIESMPAEDVEALVSEVSLPPEDALLEAARNGYGSTAAVDEKSGDRGEY